MIRIEGGGGEGGKEPIFRLVGDKKMITRKVFTARYGDCFLIFKLMFKDQNDLVNVIFLMYLTVYI